MSRYRIYIIAALCIGALTAAAALLISPERHYPLVRVHLPDQSALTFIDAPWTDQQKCRNANQKIIGTIRKNCGQCEIEESCAKQLDASWQTALAGQAIDYYVVQSGTLRIAVDAVNSSKETCMAMAEQITRDKRQTARCIPPK